MEKRSFDLKLERAHEHLDSLDTEVRKWIDTEPYGIVDEPDPEIPPKPLPGNVRARRFRVDRVSDVPGRISIIIGDCVFNLRSGLDHLALALGQKFTTNMSDTQISGSQFPIFWKQSGFNKCAPDYVGCVSPAAMASIKSLQPYQRGKGYSSHPLWQLNELNRIDKHRKLTSMISDYTIIDPPTGKRVKGVAYVYREGQNWDAAQWHYFLISPGVFKLNTVLARWAGVPVDPHSEMRLEPAVHPDVVFDKGGVASLQPVVPLLKSLCDFVGKDVIAKLSQFL